MQHTIITTLQHPATHYDALQRSVKISRCSRLGCSTATHFQCNTTILWHTTIHCSKLQYTATHVKSSVLHEAHQIAALQHTMNETLQHTATHCNTLQHTMTHCNTAWKAADAADQAANANAEIRRQDFFCRSIDCARAHICTHTHTHSHAHTHAHTQTTAEENKSDCIDEKWCLARENANLHI